MLRNCNEIWDEISNIMDKIFDSKSVEEQNIWRVKSRQIFMTKKYQKNVGSEEEEYLTEILSKL